MLIILSVLNTIPCTELDKPKVMDTAKGKTRIPGRRILADISNIPQRSTVSIQDNKSRPSSDTIRTYIEQLQKVHFFAAEITPLTRITMLQPVTVLLT